MQKKKKDIVLSKETKGMPSTREEGGFRTRQEKKKVISPLPMTSVITLRTLRVFQPGSYKTKTGRQPSQNTLLSTDTAILLH